MEDLYKNDVWYVKFPEAKSLATVVILEVTEKTILLNDEAGFGSGSRYKIEDIEFVEKKGK